MAQDFSSIESEAAQGTCGSNICNCDEHHSCASSDR